MYYEAWFPSHSANATITLLMQRKIRRCKHKYYDSTETPIFHRGNKHCNVAIYEHLIYYFSKELNFTETPKLMLLYFYIYRRIRLAFFTLGYMELRKRITKLLLFPTLKILV